MNILLKLTNQILSTELKQNYSANLVLMKTECQRELQLQPTKSTNEQSLATMDKKPARKLKRNYSQDIYEKYCDSDEDSSKIKANITQMMITFKARIADLNKLCGLMGKVNKHFKTTSDTNGDAITTLNYHTEVLGALNTANENVIETRSDSAVEQSVASIPNYRVTLYENVNLPLKQNIEIISYFEKMIQTLIVHFKPISNSLTTIDSEDKQEMERKALEKDEIFENDDMKKLQTHSEYPFNAVQHDTLEITRPEAILNLVAEIN